MKDSIEIYKDIIGYEGLYQISNFGMVKSLQKKINKKNGATVIFPEVILKQSIRSGYKCVCLYKIKSKQSFSVHRLIAIHFIENPLNKPQINHKNGIKTDNIIDNLEWVTAKENSIHSYLNNLSKGNIGEKNGQSKLTDEKVLLIRNSRYKISRKDLSKITGVSIKHIDRIRSKERWAHI